MALDVALVEAVEALRACGLACLLLKGPALAQWLYSEPEDRAYGDVDLMVDPGRFEEAERVLFGLGYRHSAASTAAHHEVWSRGRRVPIKIELHRTLFWVRCPPDRAWSLLTAGAEEMTVAGSAIPIMGMDGRLVTVVLHAAQHGPGFAQSLTDLDRALELASVEDWRGAVELAQGLDADEAFGAGLRLRPAGAALADRFHLPPASFSELMLRLDTPRETAFGFERLSQSRGWASALRLLARELVPPPEFVRVWQPVARRGRRGLVAAYLWRPLWLLWKAPTGFRAWRRAVSGARAAGRPET
jgi:putative nucleotidyltransferase-like protein